MKIVLCSILAAALGLAATTRADAAIFTNLYSFSATSFNSPAAGGYYPQAALLLSPDNVLYGTTAYGGSNDVGTIFADNLNAGGFSTIHTFIGGDGAIPVSDLILSGNTLYGTTSAGGAYGGGTIFAVSTNGTGFTNLFSFTFTNGASPQAGLVLSNNTLYGTTSRGGLYGAGTVFAVSTNGTGFTNIYNFNYTNGANPQADLLLLGNTLYGTTVNGGGSNGFGTVFAVNTDGTGFTNLFVFTGTNGANPYAGLALVSNVLCGTTVSGGSFDYGTAFLIGTNGTGFSLLHSFGASNDGLFDGFYPSRLIVSSNGDSSYTIYGTTESGGQGFDGTVFTLTVNGPTFTVADYSIANLNSSTESPAAGLVLSGDTLYGTAGGSPPFSSEGTVFSLLVNGSSLLALHSFPATQSYANTNSDGAQSFADLTLSGNTLYGTAMAGGVNGRGTIFAINTDGTGFTNLCSMNTPDAGPWAGLTLSGSTLYGIASSLQTLGGDDYFSDSDSELFAINTDGTGFTNFASLSDGSLGDLVLTSNTLYGTTELGGSYGGSGSVFSVNTDGSDLTNFFGFDESDGFLPVAGLVLSGNTLYGTTELGGSNFAGVVFAINTDGTGFTNLVQFNGADGSDPWSSLVLCGNRLYGTTESDSIRGCGTIFAVNTDGSNFTNLYMFSGYDGANPRCNLVLCSNTLYGTTSSGGAGGYGTVFSIHTDGSDFTTLYNFSGGNDGASPHDGLILSGNTLYGTTSGGGSGGNGTVFALSLGPIPLNIKPNGNSPILRWGNPAFSLEEAPAVTGPYSPVRGGASPWTNSFWAPQQFFRLEAWQGY